MTYKTRFVGMLGLLFLFAVSAVPISAGAGQSSTLAGSINSSSFAAYSSVASTPSACGVTIKHENHANDAIQLALNAASKGKITPLTVCIGSGTFPEQLNITSRGDISLVGLGDRGNPSIINPDSVVVNNYDYLYGTFAQAAIILAGNNGTKAKIDNIVIRNLVINGDGSRKSLNKYPTCYADFAGINLDGTSGSVTNNVVENMYLSRSQASCASGGGINVDINTNHSPAKSVIVENNFVPNYGEFGIACWGYGLTCDVSNNNVGFYQKYVPLSTGPAGIVIAEGTFGQVEHNVASGNYCTQKFLAVPCGPNLVINSQGSGIFTYGAASGTVIRENKVSRNDLGILVEADKTSVLGNDIMQSKYVAIETNSGTGTYRVEGNHLSYTRIGIAVVNPGYYFGENTTFISRLVSDSLSHVKINVEMITYSPGKVVVYYLGERYFVSGNSTVIIN
jgi:parallel beta-helix repeat protein